MARYMLVYPPPTSLGEVAIANIQGCFAHVGQGLRKGKLVRRGSKGPAVAVLQCALWVAGFGIGNDRRKFMDGAFGRNTETALEEFQRAYRTPDNRRIDDDGVAGPQTWAALGLPYESSTPSTPAPPRREERSVTRTRAPARTETRRDYVAPSRSHSNQVSTSSVSTQVVGDESWPWYYWAGIGVGTLVLVGTAVYAFRSN